MRACVREDEDNELLMRTQSVQVKRQSGRQDNTRGAGGGEEAEITLDCLGVEGKCVEALGVCIRALATNSRTVSICIHRHTQTRTQDTDTQTHTCADGRG